MAVQERLLGPRYRFEEGRAPAALSPSQGDARRRFLEEIHRRDRYVRLDACPFCGHGELWKISEVEHLGLPVEIALCRRCEGCFKSRILNEEAAAFYYRHLSYALRGKDLSPEGREALFRTRVETIARPKCRFIRRFVDLVPGRDVIVELGCNDGANLAPWREQGFEVLGIDLDADVVAFGQRQGLNLRCGDALRLEPSECARAKLFILSHVLEHVTDVHAALARLGALLAPDRFAYIEVPGIRGQGLGDPLKYFDVEHNYNFELRTLRPLLARHGIRPTYADEYIRAVCTSARNAADADDARGRWLPSEGLAAAVASLGLRVTRADTSRLHGLLRSAAGSGLRSRLVNRLYHAYFERQFAAATRIDGAGGGNGHA